MTSSAWLDGQRCFIMAVRIDEKESSEPHFDMKGVLSVIISAGERCCHQSGVVAKPVRKDAANCAL